MKRLPLLIALLSCFMTYMAQNNTAKKPKTVYDAALAKKLGADDYGMKPYVMVFLKAGPVRNQDSATAAAIQKAHLQNIQKLAYEGKLLVAGPFMDDSDLLGIFIFNVATVEEARKLTETDPAVKAGRLIMELHPWYGSAALVETTRIHRSLEKKSVAE
ncbi:MAG: hypothetical protein JST26_15365 [Bacteroidetes bacterium]|nr:hypothetical protein [Bacteroidota bacterium]